MILFPSGIELNQTEHKSLLHVEVDPEAWLRAVLGQKAVSRLDALINEWRPRLFADPSVQSFPTDESALANLIMARPDFKNRTQQDSERVPPEPLYLHNTGKYNAVVRAPPNLVTLFQTGLFISDVDASYILAYLQNLDDWVLGALLGNINRGKKKMLRQYHRVLMDDPLVTVIPANEDDLVNVITARDDYKTLPEQAQDRAAAASGRTGDG